MKKFKSFICLLGGGNRGPYRFLMIHFKWKFRIHNSAGPKRKMMVEQKVSDSTYVSQRAKIIIAHKAPSNFVRKRELLFKNRLVAAYLLSIGRWSFFNAVKKNACTIIAGAFSSTLQIQQVVDPVKLNIYFRGMTRREEWKISINCPVINEP